MTKIKAVRFNSPIIIVMHEMELETKMMEHKKTYKIYKHLHKFAFHKIFIS